MMLRPLISSHLSLDSNESDLANDKVTDDWKEADLTDNDVTDDNFNDDVSIVDVNVASNVGSCSRLNFFHSSVRSRFREVA